MSKPRKTGDILLDMEPFLEELCFDQDLQHGDVLALIAVWLSVHAPSQKEIYTEDGSSPVFSYGPRKK